MAQTQDLVKSSFDEDNFLKYRSTVELALDMHQVQFETLTDMHNNPQFLVVNRIGQCGIFNHKWYALAVKAVVERDLDTDLDPQTIKLEA